MCRPFASIAVAIAFSLAGFTAYAEEVPHATIPGTDLLTDEVLAKIPEEAREMREHLEMQRKHFHVGIDIPEHKAKDGTRFNTWPGVQTPYLTEFRWENGDFIKAHVAAVSSTSGTIKDAVHREASRWHTGGGAACRVELLLVVSHVLHGKSSALVLPFEVIVWRDDQKRYFYSDLKLRMDRFTAGSSPTVP